MPAATSPLCAISQPGDSGSRSRETGPVATWSSGGGQGGGVAALVAGSPAAENSSAAGMGETGAVGVESAATHSGGGVTCTKLWHLGHSTIVPIKAWERTASRARHVVQVIENNVFSTVPPIPTWTASPFRWKPRIPTHCHSTPWLQDCHRVFGPAPGDLQSR
jgi:hypothetical protein